MIRRLTIVFISGLILSITLLSSAWVLGGGEMMRHIEKEGGFSFTIDDDGDAPRLTRTFPLDPGQTLAIAVPARVRYIHGDTASMTVSGPQKMIEALEMKNGTLDAVGKHLAVTHRGISIEITAPRMPSLTVEAAVDADLEGLAQDTLRIDANGAANIDASGKVRTVAVTARGAGNVDLESVEAEDAKVRIEGVGNVDITATGAVDATIKGAGNITLHAKPRSLNSRIDGIGNIDHSY